MSSIYVDCKKMGSTPDSHIRNNENIMIEICIYKTNVQTVKHVCLITKFGQILMFS